MTEVDILESCLKGTALDINDLIEKNVLLQIIKAMNIYADLKNQDGNQKN